MTHDKDIKLRLEITNIELANKKLLEDIALTSKKNATYALTFALGIFAIGIGFAKLFL